MSLPVRLLGANPSIQVSTLLSGSLSTPSAKIGNAQSDYISLASTLVSSGGASEINFTSISSAYTTLELRFTTIQSGASNIVIQFNGDTANNYWWHEFYVDGGGVVSGATLLGGNSGSATNHIKTNYSNASGSTNPFVGVGVFNIVNYSSTAKTKVVQGITGSNTNTTSSPDGYVLYRTGIWNSTSAITSIRVFPTTGGVTFLQNTRVSLYGIKGA